MSLSPTIRVAAAYDLPALVRLFRGFMEYLGDPAPPPDELAAAILPVLTDPAAAVLIALDADGEPLGYAHLRTHYSVWMAGPESFLEDLFVEEARRDGGIGRRLLGEAAAWSRGRGCRRLRLDTNERNERGIHLYESMGFTCARDSYDGGRQLYYTLDLDGPDGA